MATITVIPGSQCIGDSLTTINSNFAALNNFVLPLATTSELSNISSTINTTNKEQGKLIFNTTNNSVYVALGSLTNSQWQAVGGQSSSTLTPA
jgi:hypothetical protein